MWLTRAVAGSRKDAPTSPLPLWLKISVFIVVSRNLETLTLLCYDFQFSFVQSYTNEGANRYLKKKFPMGSINSFVGEGYLTTGSWTPGGGDSFHNSTYHKRAVAASTTLQ